MNRIMHAIPCMFLASQLWADGVIPGTERYLEYAHALPGKILKVGKEFDSESGKIKFVSNLPELASVEDMLRIENIEAQNHRQIHGSLDAALSVKLASMGGLDKVRVTILLKSAPVAYLDKTRHAAQQLIDNSKAILAAGPVVSPLSIISRLGLEPLGYKGPGMVIVEADRFQLDQLKHAAEVASIWEENQDVPLADPELPTLATSGYNPGPVPSGSGLGVRAATYEYGITSAFLSCIGVSPASYDAFPNGGDGNVMRHSQASFRVMSSAAPSGSLYHRKSQTYNGSGDVDYLVNNAIQTVSLSKSRGGTTPYRATYSEFLTMDNMAYTYPYPVFVNPAGNSGYSYEVNWQCYNAISIGNVRHTSQSTFEMADCTQTKNPPPRYGSCISGSGSDCAGDREMPHIVAPGIPPSGTTFATTCLEGTGTVSCGTSWSSAVANGLAASVIASDSRLVSWPEKVRATLILTAQNVESGDWTVSSDERDGTGVISASDAVSFAQGHTSVAPGNTAVEKGMYASSMYASDFGSNKRFNFLVPNPKPSGKHLRVVLTWDSNPDVNAGTNNLSDLDLIVQHNSGTSYSSSWDSNVEVVDIPAANLTAGNSYYIDVSPYMSRIPSTGTNYFYYAVAWTWVKDHAP